MTQDGAAQIDSDGPTRTLSDLWRIFLTPELERRAEQGGSLSAADINRAQVLFYPDDRPRVIRFNGEVRAQVKVSLREGTELSLGDEVAMGDIVEWAEVRLHPDDDQDCGHITLMRTADSWLLAFDAVYNRRFASSHLDKANEFLAAARDSAQAGRAAAAAESLFAAVELGAKAYLLTFADAAFRAKTNHRAIKVRFNEQSKFSNIPAEHAKLLNTLSDLRSEYRYRGDGQRPTVEKLDAWLALADELLRDVRSGVRRAS